MYCQRDKKKSYFLIRSVPPGQTYVSVYCERSANRLFVPHSNDEENVCRLRDVSVGNSHARMGWNFIRKLPGNYFSLPGWEVLRGAAEKLTKNIIYIITVVRREINLYNILTVHRIRLYRTQCDQNRADTSRRKHRVRVTSADRTNCDLLSRSLSVFGSTRRPLKWTRGHLFENR